jgi:hypothetical protein
MHTNCSLTFTPPVMDLTKRWCNPNDVRRCSKSWEDAEVEAQSEAYTAHVCSGLKTYRNRHCLLCNNLDVSANMSILFSPLSKLTHTVPYCDA